MQLPVSRVASLAVLPFLAATAIAQANNECAGAIAVVNGPNGPFSNVGATTSTPAWPCGNGGTDVWFAYVATCTNNLTIDTCTGTTYDSTLEVFSGSCGALTSLGCNDDSCALQSRLVVPVTANQTYLIRVGGYNGATGTFTLNLGCAGGGGGGPGDECTTASPVALGSNGPYSNVGFTTSQPQLPCGNGGNDRWFAFTPARTAPYTFRTCSGTRSFDTVLEVLSGSCGALSGLGCNDDSCGLGSEVVANLTGGVTSYVRVGGYSSATGSFDLEIVLGSGQGTIALASAANCGPTGINVTGNPVLGGTIGIALSNIIGIPFLGIGFSNPGTVLCGCMFGSDWSFVHFGTTFSLAIPADPAHIGTTFFTQGVDLFGLGGCANPQFSATNTYLVQIG